MREPRNAMNFEPNVTPFLDILLVLLILFMFVSVNQRKVLQTHLPDANARGGDADVTIVLEVQPNSMYAINTQPVRGDELGARLRALYSNRPTKTILVRGAAGVRYQDVATAVDIAKGAGVVAVGLAPRESAVRRRPDAAVTEAGGAVYTSAGPVQIFRAYRSRRPCASRSAPPPYRP